MIGLGIGLAQPARGPSSFFDAGTALDFAKATLAGLLAASVTNTVATTNPPGTVTTAGGVVQYAPHNFIRNSMAQGGATGSPGTMPTNWAAFGNNVGTIAPQVVAVGTVGGYGYVDVRFAGTSAGAGGCYVMPETGTVVPAAVGQQWTHAAGVGLVGGSLAGINNGYIGIQEYDSGNNWLTESGFLFTPNADFVSRWFTTRTLTQATTAFVKPILGVEYIGIVAIDITIRVYTPQLMRGATMLDFIPTTSAASYAPRLTYSGSDQYLLTEAAATNLMVNSAAVAAQSITVTNGATYTISFYGNSSSVTFSGAYTGTVSNTGGRKTQTFVAATTTLTIASTTGSPVLGQVEVGDRATSYIPTGAAAVTRSGDLINLPANCVTDGPMTALVEGIPLKAALGGSLQILVSRFQLFGLPAYITAAGVPTVYDATTGVGTGSALSDGVLFRIASRWGSGTMAISANNSAPASGAFDGSMGVGSAVALGQDGAGASPFSGLIRSVKFIGVAANDAQLQQLSAGTLS